jgi:hypothetical protein
MGALMTWNRRKDQPSMKWHMECSPNGTELSEEQEMEQEQEQVTTKTNGHANGHSANGNGWLDGFAQAILPFVEDKISTKLDGKQVEDIVKRMLNGAVIPTVTTVKLENKETGEAKDLGVQHKDFPTLLSICSTKQPFRLNTWLTGPAGSGKTTACQKVAEALELKFYHIGAMDNEYKLMGFIDAQGRVVNTQFKDWYRDGGVLCMDEIDSWLPAATLALNAALDNGHCAFPDGLMARHQDAIAIACANTWGLGATNDYVGRMKQDAAFLERFPAQFDWGYDEGLELAISGNPEWVKRVQHFRKNAKAKGLKVIISPRASKYGAALLANGLEQSLVEQLTIRKGMTQEQWSMIQ